MSLAFVFPGQGSQSVGMLSDLAQSYPIVKETFDQASAVLGYDLWALTQNGPAEDLNQTDKTQPAMLAAGVAVWRVWQEKGGATPSVMAGHSLGEYTAMVCAGVLNFEDAIKLVSARGQYMQEAVPAGTGAMAAVLGLDDAVVIELCEKSAEGDVLSAVNFNSPGQVVVAGSKDAVDRLVEAAKEAGAKRSLVLPVSVPSHCALMQPAADRLKADLENIAVSQPAIPVINNVDVEAASEAGEITDGLVRQLYSPVRWVETIQKMASQGVDQIIECGPGKVLAGLNKRIDRGMAATAVFDSTTLDSALEK